MLWSLAESYLSLSSPSRIPNALYTPPSHTSTPLKNLSLNNLHLLHRPIRILRLHSPNLIHDIHSLHHMPKHSMLPVQMRRRRQRNKELTPICPGPAIRHAEGPFVLVREGAVELVLEFLAVDGFAARAGARGVAALDHEVWDYAVEDDVVVFVGCGQRGEVLACLVVVGGWLAELRGDGMRQGWRGRYPGCFVGVEGYGDVSIVSGEDDSLRNVRNGGGCRLVGRGALGLVLGVALEEFLEFFHLGGGSAWLRGGLGQEGGIEGKGRLEGQEFLESYFPVLG
jgi:hypothetical protein